MTSSNFDADIIAAQQARTDLIRKISILATVVLFVSCAVYLILNSFGSSDISNSDDNLATTIQLTQNSSENESILAVARDELQQMLVFAENAVTQIEQDPGKNNWNSQGITALRNNLNLAYGSYSNEDYQQASRQLAQLQSAVAEFEQDYKAQWQTAFQLANEAFEQQEITEARLQNQIVLDIYPNHQPAMELQERLNVWQAVQEQLEALRVAQVENNQTKQLAILQQILSLDPQNQDIQAQKQALEKTIKDQKFAQAIARAKSALDARDINQTQSALEKATLYYPNRQEIQHIQRQLDRLIAEQSIARFEQQIATMQQVDNWAAAQKLSASAKSKHPDHDKFQLSHTLASRILDLQSQVQAFLNAPERLTDDNIRRNAQSLLIQTAEVEVASGTLKTKADELRSALDNSVQTMAVTVISDGRTDIRVLGTGVVGKTKNKVIQLLPGNYRFEGRREGYHSKILTFTVKATQEPQVITLICDQRI